MPLSPWPHDADLWFVASERHDGKWVVIGGLRGAPVMMGRPHATQDEAQRQVGRLWAEMQDIAQTVLIGPPSPIKGT